MRISSKNIWGSAGSGLDHQRSDLWMADFGVAIKSMLLPFPNVRFHVRLVNLPTLDMVLDNTRRESRQYYLPGYDKVVEPVTVSFHYSLPTDGQIYNPCIQMLTEWRSRVRAGRGAMSGESAHFISADTGYAVQFRWDIPLRFLRGDASTTSKAPLVTSSAFLLKNAWLAGFRVSPELNVADQSRPVQIDASFVVEDILPVPADGTAFVHV